MFKSPGERAGELVGAACALAVAVDAAEDVGDVGGVKRRGERFGVEVAEHQARLVAQLGAHGGDQALVEHLQRRA